MLILRNTHIPLPSECLSWRYGNLVSLPLPSVINLYTHSPTHSTCLLCPCVHNRAHRLCPSQVFDHAVSFGCVLQFPPCCGTMKMATQKKGLVSINDKRQDLELELK